MSSQVDINHHENALQWSGTTGSWADVCFNTYLRTQIGGAEVFQFYGGAVQGVLASAICNNNVLIGRGPSGSISNLIHGGPVVAGQCCNNWVDTSGAFGNPADGGGTFYPGSMAGWKVSGNINLLSGAGVGPQ